MPTQNPIYLAGSTAVGKSAVAMAIAELIPAEIVSVDSMQVYRGMDIGTSKPSKTDQNRVPHHLIDVISVTEPFDAARFVNLASASIAEILDRGRTPILCGGTGLYFQALLYGILEAPGSDPVIRQQLEGRSLSSLTEELKQLDAESYQHIDLQNPRRVIRALEVIKITGRPYSEFRSDWRTNGSGSPANLNGQSTPILVLNQDVDILNQRIEARVDVMFKQGLVEETRCLMQQGLGENKTALQALGYRQVVDYLSGKMDLPSTVALIKVRTRQFAKRQRSWFRNQSNSVNITLDPHESLVDTAKRTLRMWQNLTRTPKLEVRI